MNKRYIKLIVALLVFSVLFFVTIGINLIKKNSNNDYIIIDDEFIINNHNNTWSLIKKDIKNFNWKFYNIYINHEFFGNHYLYLNDEVYIFNSDKKALSYTGDLIAFNNNNYKDVYFDIKNSIDNTYLNKVLQNDKIDSIDGLNNNYYIDVDMDNDNEYERIYVVTNKFSEENESGVDVSYVFYVDNGKINIIYRDIVKNTDHLSGCIPYVRNIITNGDSNYLLLECSSYSVGDNNITLYEYKNNRFIKKISTNYK